MKERSEPGPRPQDLGKALLVVVVKNRIDALDRLHLFRIGDRIAADHDDLRAGMGPNRSSNRGARGLGRLARDGAGVDDDHVGRIVRAGLRYAVRREVLGHEIGLRLIEAAAERSECDFWSVSSLHAGGIIHGQPIRP